MAEYVGVTAIKVIEREQHLFLEVYRNDKTCRKIPVVRIVLNEKDFGTFFPGSGTWSRGRITRNTWDNYGLIWREEDERILKSAIAMEEENILYSKEDMERIKAFTNVDHWRESQWWKYIDKRQENITTTENREKSRRRYERRQQALEERERLTPELPEKRILEYADRVIFHGSHYLFYKKHGVRAMIACSKCGGVSDERWKPGMSYESTFERMIQEPRMGDMGTCPMCGARGAYIPQGRAKSFHRKTAHLFLGQRYKKGMVFRYIEVGKEWQIELIGEEIFNAREQVDGVEIARAYFEPGKKTQIDYHKHNQWSGNDFWDDCNLSGMNNIYIKEAHIMPETYGNIKGTFLEYSALREYERAAGDVNVFDYIERYIQTPQIEMIVKLGLTKIAGELVRCRYGIINDENADRIDTFLGIRKERVAQLIEHKGDTGILRTMQMEKRIGQNWTREQIEQITELDTENIRIPLQYMGIQKFLNRVSRYAGCDYGTMCSHAVDSLQRTAQTYIDYLTMRNELGYDMKNTVYLFPKYLLDAHQKMVLEKNKEEADKKIRRANETYKMIRKHYRRLRKRFYFEDDMFLIRPARDAGEIIMEGRILHHCVGGDRYLKNHDEGRNIILFLRDKEQKDMPYITVEIGNEDLKIRQWYGAYDRQPDKDVVQKWLDAYVMRLRYRLVPEAAGQEGAEQQILAYA